MFMHKIKLMTLGMIFSVGIFNANISSGHDITFSLPNPSIADQSYTSSGHILPLLTPKQIAELRENLAQTQLLAPEPAAPIAESPYNAPAIPGPINPIANRDSGSNEELINALYNNPGPDWTEAKLTTKPPIEIHYWFSSDKKQAIVRISLGKLITPKVVTHISNPANDTHVYKFNYTPLLLWVNDQNNKTYTLHITDSVLTSNKKTSPPIHAKKTDAMCEVSVGNRILSIC